MFSVDYSEYTIDSCLCSSHAIRSQYQNKSYSSLPPILYFLLPLLYARVYCNISCIVVYCIILQYLCCIEMENDMKRKLLIGFTIILVLLLFHLCSQPTLHSVITSQSAETYKMSLAVVLNQPFVWNKARITNQLLERTIHNQFHNMQFSYDELGYPSELEVTVYANALSRRWGSPAFSFRYMQDEDSTYNIKEHPDKFEIIY